MVRAYSTSPSFVWDTAQYGSGTYNISIWIKNTGSPAQYDTYTQGTYALTYSTTPTVRAFAAGLYHVCALKSSGAVDCFGRSSNGEVGSGTIGTNAVVPAAVTGLSGASAIAAGYNHTCAVVSGGTVGVLGRGHEWAAG